jgi:hypothetical protein
MKKNFAVVLALILVVTFTLSMVGTLAFAKPPKCDTCRKDGCPEGYCYVDCVGCCYVHPVYGVICFR